ncbi:hypothetical protein BOW53_14530 [Solemya pervernicosa gill symbiont]|uniref:UPF0033 domain-containing protein n=2 Tax=Gammaproteobacteria incertae sedis TaxID=118884 RepID=A0A1T2L0V2_9GAMM|nr:hypothetical protein BOW53_14530 [Solemya pervernicosa gill symbiont]
MSDNEQDISVIGSSCPVPLIKLSQAVAEMAQGETLTITGDDPIFEVGVRDFCEANGHEILDVKVHAGGRIEIHIKV